MAALDETVQNLGDFGRKDIFDGATVERALPARIHHLAESAVGKHDTAIRIERRYTVGDGLEHCFELTSTGFEGSVRGAQLHG